MTVISQSSEKTDSPLARAFFAFSFACVLVFVGLLGIFGVSLTPLGLASVAALLLWLAFRYPITGLGSVLAFMPIYTLAFLLAKFFGPPYIALLEGCDRAVLLLFTLILWRRNGIKLTLPDWLLLICLGLATLHLFFAGSLIGLLTDFNFVIAYAAGRVTNLTTEQQTLWAKRAVWIVAVVSALGMVEVFIIGEAPRTVLYLSVGGAGTQGGTLDAAFHGDNYSGLRESATMFGPLQFAPLCMAALMLWWVYCRKLIPGVMIAGGLICSVTRSAWVGTAAAGLILAVLMGQTKFLLRYGAVMLALFMAAIPVLGLGDYLFSTKNGQDLSAQGHRTSILEGLQFVSQHPFGMGPGTVGRWAVKEDTNALGIEDTYLTIAAEYGIPALLCFVGFIVATVTTLRRERNGLAWAAIAILTGFSVVTVFAALHDVFPLACWVWFPVGLAIRSSIKEHSREAVFQQGS